MWFPFRFFEFGIGMAVGYAMVVYPATLRRIFGDARVAALLLAVAVAMHTAGGWIDAREGYWDAMGYDVLVGGLAIAIVALVVARPGRVLQSAPARLVAWIGTLSYAVLIVNGSFFFINNYLILERHQWSLFWWYYIVVLYVPLTIVLAYPLSAVLGLLPKKPAVQVSETPPPMLPELQRA
jgi:peptidoglycan/LPS O-acetylase OafA/YrhL